MMIVVYVSLGMIWASIFFGFHKIDGKLDSILDKDEKIIEQLEDIKNILERRS